MVKILTFVLHLCENYVEGKCENDALINKLSEMTAKRLSPKKFKVELFTLWTLPYFKSLR